MNEWSKVTEEQKDGKIYLLCVKDKKIGPWMGYFWKAGNCWLSCERTPQGYAPTHYFSLKGLLFE